MGNFLQKRLFLLFLSFAYFSFPVFSQNTIWIETFEDLTNGATSDVGATPWALTSNGADDLAVRPVVDGVAGGDDFWLTFDDTDLNGSDEWSSGDIDITAYNQNNSNTGVNITIDLYETTGLQDSDIIRAYYTLDGGAEIDLEEGNLTNDFGYSLAYALNVGQNATFTDLRLFVEVLNNDNEIHHIDNIRVFEQE